MNVLTAVLAVSFLQFFETRNQVANFVIDPPPEGTSVTVEKPQLTVRDTCPGCEGKGQLVLEEPDFGQSKGRLGSAKKIKKECPLCKGRGRIESFVNPSELALQVSQDLNAFAAAHQGRGEIRVGEAFVPNARHRELSESKDKARLKLVEDAFGHPCKKCNWTGLEACTKCKGRGVISCNNSDCKGGWAVVKTTTEKTRVKSGGSSGIRNGGFRSGGSHRSSTKETTVNVSPCPVCGGTKFTVCPDCGGRRAHPCTKCNGLGIKMKGAAL